MKVFKTIKGTTEFLEAKRISGSTIGFVPTMGALHNGHLELMRQAKKENDLLVVSIFVNPIQFNNKEDLIKYPRDIEKDKALLLSVGCDLLFAPSVEEMYPEGEEQKKYDFGSLEKVMEGASRPGHFNGVGVVVSKLFKICIPRKAYFGEKDFQQLAIIKKLVEIETIPVEIVPCAIVREQDGLAMSSRNQRLTAEERKSAPFIYEVLQLAQKSWKTLSPLQIKQLVISNFDSRKEYDLEYFELADDINLQPIDSFDDKKGTIGFIAVYLGNVRLIDNIRII